MRLYIGLCITIIRDTHKLKNQMESNLVNLQSTRPYRQEGAKIGNNLNYNQSVDVI